MAFMAIKNGRHGKTNNHQYLTKQFTWPLWQIVSDNIHIDCWRGTNNPDYGKGRNNSTQTRKNPKHPFSVLFFLINYRDRTFQGYQVQMNCTNQSEDTVCPTH
jgi:hypothetical protein